jgi:rfaE bifunctional protein kinase chain/domain/rfaE bifunctional protein nucleotidyltransferase chain/domain
MGGGVLKAAAVNGSRAKGAGRPDKIRDLDDLALELRKLRRQGKTIVHCHGVFDLLHIGHIRHFEEAKAMGDVLVVTLTPDRYVNKGPHRPAFPQELRAEMISSLGVVDYVAVNRWPTSVETIKLLRPSVYAKGPDYKDASKDVTGGILREERAVRSAGGCIRYTDGITFSSTNLLNANFQIFPKEVRAYIERFRGKYSPEDVAGAVDGLRNLKVLVLGEAIIDEYVYGSAMGKSAKEPILALQYDRTEKYGGGTLAIANHAAALCDEVEVASSIGTVNPQREFLRKSLRPNARPRFFPKSGSPTILKRRFVESYSLNKLIEVYEMNDDYLSRAEERAFLDYLEKRLPRFDVVIAADYGHGMMTPAMVELLSSRKAPFLAVNTQINAANIGFHTISKYPRADYICIHEGEIRLDHRNRHEELGSLIEKLSKRMRCPQIMVTQGKKGTLFYRQGEGMSACPSLALRIVDRTGAGDAVLTMTALLAARGVPSDVIGFLGNIAGAQAVATVGNSVSLDRVGVLKTAEAFLK